MCFQIQRLSGSSNAVARSKATALRTLSNCKRSSDKYVHCCKDDGTGNKQFPIVVRTFYQFVPDVCSDVLAIPVCKGSATGENKNKNFMDPQTEIHSNNKFGASIFGKSKTNKKYNCACNMTFTSIVYSCC